MTSTEQLLNVIIEAIQDKKGKEIVSLNFGKLEQAFCDYFVICQGDSNTQVEAIANSVEEKTIKNANEKPLHMEGMQNANWVLVDYGNIIVHVFQSEYREFYNLESLWADAEQKKYEE